jgi:hypothetical protein
MPPTISGRFRTRKTATAQLGLVRTARFPRSRRDSRSLELELGPTGPLNREGAKRNYSMKIEVFFNPCEPPTAFGPPVRAENTRSKRPPRKIATEYHQKNVVESKRFI